MRETLETAFARINCPGSCSKLVPMQAPFA